NTPIAATTATIGQDIAPIAVAIAPNPATMVGINPTNKRNIPANIEPTAVNAVIATITALIGSGILLNAVTTFVIACTISRNTGSSVSLIDNMTSSIT